MRQAPGEKAHIHLRTDPDGSGLLLVNASRVMHLNPSAAFMARLALDETPGPQAISEITRRFQVSKQQAETDYTQFCNQLEDVIRPDGLCPIHDLDLDVIPPFSAQPAAPYRMDLALTYRCNNDCAHCYNARPRGLSPSYLRLNGSPLSTAYGSVASHTWSSRAANLPCARICLS